ncbi:hypothetical protein CC78DRAFT_308836 [Lojkania enalia]|uniref:Uncharacterized protein n=1 Tax=Lojkania enalia TaxID=147567 RepID=A0A9P4N9V5_9PLEO|nr:hypothetical protein CC78DRAFT_308836 [Didymosphaeria enalia]
MGLPMWRAPSPEAKDAIKADLTAPARSPIRRRSSFAGRHARPTRSPRSPRQLENDFLTSASRFAPPEPTARPSSSRLRPPPPPVPESRNYSHHGDSARDTPRLHSEESGLDRLRRERYYFAMHHAASLGEVTRSPRPLPALTPNFAPAAAARYSNLDEHTMDRSRLRSRSPNHRLAAPSRSPWADAQRSGPRRDNMVIVEDGDGDSSDNAVGSPPLRRMGRRTIADGPLPSSSLRESWSPTTSTLDGLGDRERSFSPVNDHWDTMLSTVVQDPLAPTADSSFTSAAASASFSNSHPSSRAGSANSNSASSSRTHLTVPSRRHSPTELFIRACDTSDDETASDTEEEDMETRPVFSSLRRRSQPSYAADEPPSRDPARYSRGVRDRSRDASVYVRGFYSGSRLRDQSQQPESNMNEQVDGPTERLRSEMHDMQDELQVLDQELRDARAILERLSRRDDISDEFWASVGLARPVAENVQDRPTRRYDWGDLMERSHRHAERMQRSTRTR